MWLMCSRSEVRCCGQGNEQGSGHSELLMSPARGLCRAAAGPGSPGQPRSPRTSQLMSSAALCTPLNLCSVTSTALSFTAHCQPCLGLLSAFSFQFCHSLYKTAPSSDPCFPHSVLPADCSPEWQHGWHRQSNKSVSKFGPWKMKS